MTPRAAPPRGPPARTAPGQRRRRRSCRRPFAERGHRRSRSTPDRVPRRARAGSPATPGRPEPRTAATTSSRRSSSVTNPRPRSWLTAARSAVAPEDPGAYVVTRTAQRETALRRGDAEPGLRRQGGDLVARQRAGCQPGQQLVGRAPGRRRLRIRLGQQERVHLLGDLDERHYPVQHHQREPGLARRPPPSTPGGAVNVRPSSMTNAATPFAASART